MGTAGGIFQQLGLYQWWNSPTQTFGINGEKGTDFGLSGFGVPVGSITAGRVVYVGDGGYPGSSIGQIVQIQSSDGLYHYQHLQSSNVSVGQTVNVGDIIGTSGGCPVGAYPASGTGCTRYDQYSTGEHIEVRWSPTYNPQSGVWNQNWQDPLSQFLSVAGAQTQTPLTGGGSTLAMSNSSSPGSGTSFFDAFGQKAGLLVAAAVFLILGLVLLFHTQIGGALRHGTHIAPKQEEPNG